MRLTFVNGDKLAIGISAEGVRNKVADNASTFEGKLTDVLLLKMKPPAYAAMPSHRFQE